MKRWALPLGGAGREARWGDTAQDTRSRARLRSTIGTAHALPPRCQVPGHVPLVLLTFISLAWVIHFNLKSLDSDVGLKARPPSL